MIEELVKFTLRNRDRSDYLVDRYSERKSSGRLKAEHTFVTAAMMQD